MFYKLLLSFILLIYVLLASQRISDLWYKSPFEKTLTNLEFSIVIIHMTQ